MKTLFQILTIVVIACLFVLMGVGIGKECGQKEPIINVVEKVDTLFICDTIKVTEPLYVKERIVDSVLVAVTDTIVRNDTTFITLPRQERKYQSPQFQAWVSGYDPKLDSIKLYQTTKTITKEIPVIQKQKPRFSLGITGGYGAGKDGLTPFVGVGLTYNLLSW